MNRSLKALLESLGAKDAAEVRIDTGYPAAVSTQPNMPLPGRFITATAGSRIEIIDEGECATLLAARATDNRS